AGLGPRHNGDVPVKRMDCAASSRFSAIECREVPQEQKGVRQGARRGYTVGADAARLARASARTDGEGRSAETRAAYEDRYYWSHDGLRLHYRDYAGPKDKFPHDRPIILCIPGLTRNARDYEAVAERLAGRWRVWCLDLRGRGDSAYAKDPLTYV